MNQNIEPPAAKLTALKGCRHGKMLYLKNDYYIGRALDLYGEFSELEGAIFKDYVQPGDTVVEVGSNIGAHTVHLARLVGQEGTVFAFEPQRVVFQILCANVALNELFNVRTYYGAFGRTMGTIKVPPMDYGAESNFGGVSMKISGNGEDVPLWKMDGINFAALNMLKVDVEGMEIDVLTGARDTIGKFRPVLYVENDRASHSEELISLIGELGYDMWWHLPKMFNPDNFAKNPENVFDRLLSINLLCLPKERHEKIARLWPVSGPKQWWKQLPSLQP